MRIDTTGRKQRRAIVGGAIASVILSIAWGSLAANATAVTKTTVPFPGTPLSIAVDPLTNTVFAVLDTGELAVYDGSSPSPVLNFFTVGVQPETVAVDPVTRQVFVTNYSPGTVRILDEDNLGGPQKLVGVGAGPRSMAIDPTTHFVYVSDNLGSEVSEFDPSGAGSPTVYAVPVGKNPGGIAVDPATKSVVVTSVNDGTVSIFGTVLGGPGLVSTIPIGGSPFGLALNRSTHTAFVSEETSRQVVAFDYRAASPVVAPVAAVDEPGSIVVDPNTGTIYVADYDGHTLTQFGGPTPPRVITLDEAPNTMAIDPSTHSLLVGTTLTPTTGHISTISTPVAPRITSASQFQTVSQGEPFEFHITAIGEPAPSLSLQASTGSSVPEGLSIDQDGALTGPVTADAGVYRISIVATNGVDPMATQEFTLTVVAALTTSPSSTPRPTNSPVPDGSGPHADAHLPQIAG
ncbi:MAG: hypothetical protein JWQ19_1863 [Subtercola sp.]|nr:hypothetical protein [Subtercola sp.]